MIYQPGDLVRMKKTARRRGETPNVYWMAGCIGKLIRKNRDGSWQIRFDGCGNVEGTFYAPDHEDGLGANGYTEPDVHFEMWARLGSPENPRPTFATPANTQARYRAYNTFVNNYGRF